ncbi:MAG: hypothetical protein R8G01_13735 [Ilumatobacteraceae bacterium]|nr:hypothetical protein [Ilumatobacteraceae bacterium]
MTMLEERLRSLGDALDLEPGRATGADPTEAEATRSGGAPVESALAAAVLARLDEPPVRRGHTVLRVAAALVIVVALVAVAVPSSRRTVADWFGFDGARIERRPAAPTVSTPDPFDDAPTTGADGADVSDDPAAGSIGTVVDVDGTDILVSEFVGTLDNPAIGKTVGDGTNVRQVDVGGQVGIWIDGAPHDVSFLDDEGDIVFERFAGNTLLWQDGDVVRRLEGFADVAAAIEYAEHIEP